VGDEKYIKVLVEKYEGKRAFHRSGNMWQDNIKIKLKGKACDSGFNLFLS
jgi:hypothetical protein